MSARAELLTLWHDFNALYKATSLMSWDQQVKMPAGGSEARAAQVALLSRKAHSILISDEMRRAAENLRDRAENEEDQAMARAALREIEVNAALPADYVARKRRAASRSYDAWKQARLTDDFSLFEPHLQGIIELVREAAALRGYTNHPYNALTDEYEQGASFEMWTNMFAAWKAPLRDLLRECAERPLPSDQFLYGDWDLERLRAWAQQTTEAMGFDYSRGRLDLANNAFASNFAVDDVRMTTRAKDHLGGVIFSSLHEMGHALYEQNMPREWDRTPLVGGISLGLHESQSRFWENVVGRSRAFWEWAYPSLRAAFPSLPELDVFFPAMNRISPGLVRIGSDEISYNLHILSRFELEVEMVTGRLKAKDLPEAWRAKYEENLGQTPPSNALGCLQDVHWSKGSFGYFPTYSLGNLISWQCWEAIVRDQPDWESRHLRGDFSGTLDWLREKIYRHGKWFGPRELAQAATGAPYADHGAFQRAMRARYLG
jgi:carboxypeptidase Taq